MRIAQVVTYISADGAFGGPVAVALQQSVELARRGHEVHLYAAWDGQAKPEAPGVRLHLFHALGPRTALTALVAPTLPFVLWRRRHHFDAVHLHFGRDLVSFSAWLALRRSRQRLVVQPHGMLPIDDRLLTRLFDSMITRPALARAAAVLTLTAKEQTQLAQVARGPIEIQRLDNGIAVTSPTWDPPAGPPEVLFLARLHPRKQVLIFARAARELLNAGVDARFRIIGPDEGDLEALEQYLDEAGLGDRLRYDGTIGPGDSPAALARAAVYVLPSTGEVHPMTVLEAMAIGTPVVLSEDCGLSDRLGPAGAVAITPPTTSGLVAVLRGLLADDEARMRLSERGHRYASENLTIGAVAERLLALYESRPRQRVAILQPYIPEYRVPLWSRVIDELDAAGVEARVFWGGSGRTVDRYRDRGDLRTPAWSTKICTIELHWSRAMPPFVIRLLPRGWRNPQVLLTEMQVTNLNAWFAALRQRRFVTMGHGVSGTTTSTRLADALESMQNRRATQVLVYTPEGQAAVASMTGLSDSKIASFDNATDTDRLRRALDRVRPDDLDLFRRANGIAERDKVALYIGALEPYKRIDMLVDAARMVLNQASSNWHLVVAGDGPERQALEELAIETGRVTILGRVGPEVYAPAARAASLLLNPGRIGLVAVDALTIGLPILTTTSADHAPEYSYLHPGDDVIIGGDTAADFSAAWLETDWNQRDSRPSELGTDRSAQIIAETVLAAISSPDRSH